MRKVKRIISMLVVVSMIMQFIPATRVEAATVVSTSSEIVNEEVEEVEEVVHLDRDIYSKHTKRLKDKEELNTYVFENADGTNTLYIMDENVKYIDKNGKIKDKNIKLKRSGKGLSITDNDFQLMLSDDIYEGINFEYNDIDVLLVPELEKIKKNNISSQIEDNSVIYKDVFGEAIDLKYTPLLSGLKEDIILNKYTKTNKFNFTLYTNGKNVYLEDGRYYLADNENSDTKIYIGDIIVYDAVGKPTEGTIKIVPQVKGREYKVKISVDKKFLEDSTTIYPVTIDPTIITSDAIGGSGAIEDCPVFSDRANYNHGAYLYNRVGYANDGYGIGRTAIRLNGLSNNTNFQSLTASQIESAKFYIRDASGNPSRTLDMYAFTTTTNWTESNLTWSTLPTTSPVSLGSTTLPSNGKCYFDVTQYIKYCKRNILDIDNGFIIKSSDETINKTFFSSEYSNTSYIPYIEIVYTYDASIRTGTYFIKNVATGKYVDINGPSMNEGATILQWQYSGLVQQSWILTNRSDGYYTIRSSYSGKYLGTSDVSGEAPIYQYDMTSANMNRLLWKIVPTTSGNYQLVAKCSIEYDRALSIDRNSDANGSNLYQYWYSDDTNYRDEWEIVEAEKELSAVPNNLESGEEHWCIPCAITNVAAYWCIVGGYSQFNCATTTTQEIAAKKVQANMDAKIAGGCNNRDLIYIGLNTFSHTDSSGIYGLRVDDYITKEHTEEETILNIIEEINAGRPLLLGYKKYSRNEIIKDGEPPHMTVCIGYSWDEDVFNVHLSDAFGTEYAVRPFDNEINDYIGKISVVKEDW
ncbi:MAG: DNRLRE domain-containing protein [Lachnospira sp.]|nr:DNRLRE domain-containing protein [Lachnospira sp.]